MGTPPKKWAGFRIPGSALPTFFVEAPWVPKGLNQPRSVLQKDGPT